MNLKDSSSAGDQKGYGRTATQGIAWNMIAILLSQGTSFAAQLLLGWILSKDDFALYALAISMTTLVNTARNGKIETLLIQQGENFKEQAPSYFRFALTFNFGIAFILLILSFIAPGIYQNRELLPMLVILACSIPLGTSLVILRSSLLTKMQFRLEANLNLLASIFQQVCTVILALSGFGPYSFVIPALLIPIFHTYLVKRYESMQYKGVVSWQFFRETFKQTKWLMLGALGVSLVMSGDYLVVGYLEPAQTLALYFFGYQLTLAFGRLFINSSFNVLLSTLSRLQGEKKRQQDAFIRMLRCLATIVTPCCMLFGIFSPILLHYAWMGKWDGSIIVVQSLSILLSFLLLGTTSRALLEANRQFSLSTLLVLIDAVGTILAVAIGALIGGLYWILGALVLFRGSMSVVRCIIAGRRVEISVRAILGAISPGIVYSFLFWIAAEVCSSYSTDFLGKNIIGLLIYTLLLALSWPWFLKPQITLLLQMIRKK